jgi:UDP-GlcNAc:undecaprenyl-phosphate/decaprenyl-phosphate GlcNAc-1-phosphate transferase
VSFPFNAYFLAMLSALATTLVALPLWRRWCLRTGLVDDPGHRKIHEQPIPLAGGLAVMTGLLLPSLAAILALWWQGRHGTGPLLPLTSTPVAPLEHGLGRRGLELAGLCLGALGMLLVGWLDDKHELRPQAKFAGQVLIGLLVAASGVRITLFVHSVLFHYAITVLWFLTVINAFNFMDNMNGLCAGLGAIAAWCFAVIAAAGGQYLVALIGFLTFGALLGFLPYNFPRARAFLGDAGSHLVGYLVAALAVLPHFYTRHHSPRWLVLLPMLVLGVPLLDMAWVVLLRLREGRPFYVGDTNHWSHRLVARGLSRTRAVLVIWLVAALLGALAGLGCPRL